MKSSTSINLLLLLCLSLSIASCSKSDESGSSAISITEDVIGDNSDDTESQASIVEEFTKLYEQNFESLGLQGSWMLSDFGLQGEKDKELYVVEDSLGFDIRWTKRTRNLLADKLGYQRSEMTHALANSLCEPKIEIGKESVYGSSGSSNVIAELDSDLSHCGITGTKPAALTIRSFVPTKAGYKYKVKVRYMMRSYGAQSDKSYRDLVVRFGGELEKFDPVFGEFQTVELEMTAGQKYSKLVIKDNGLPDSFGILIDDIIIEEGGKAALYDQCEKIFSVHSSGFRKCIRGEIATDKMCDLSDISQAVVKSSKVDAAPNRRDKANIFNISPAQNGHYNFYSLGLKGRVSVSCAIGGNAALYPIAGKTVALREISWGNATMSSYPELAKVRIKLSDCDDDSLNGVVNLGNVGTNEFFSYTFDLDSEGRSFQGCNMHKLIIKDITPTGPSADGFDLNSLQFSN
jgi:hypothetical protein